jgi:branched-chain amino acid transport system substrate-binding protein
MKKSMFLFVAVIMVVSLALSACTQPAAAPTAAPQAPAAPEATVAPAAPAVVDTPVVAPAAPIKIGTSLPLTGEFSITGTKHQNGYQLCVDLINEGGGLLGRPVELIVSDNQSDVDTTLAQMERFINVDKVDLIFGTFSSKLTFPASSVTEQAKILHPIPSAAALRVYERGFKYLVYFQPNAAEYIGASPVMMIKDLIPADQQPATVALAWADDFYANAAIAGLRGDDVKFQNNDGTEKTISLKPGELSKLNAKVVFEVQWPEGYSDWTTLASKLKAANADFLFAPVTSADEAINLIRALQQVAYNPKGIFMTHHPGLLA